MLLSMHESWLKDQMERPENKNLMVRKFGRGPDGATCGECAHLVQGSRPIYWKCKPRGISNGAGTDHRKGWAACSKFFRRVPGEESGKK